MSCAANWRRNMASSSMPAPFSKKTPMAKRLSNTTVVFDRKGEEIALYRKIHMFDVTTPDGASYRESAVFHARRAGATYECEGMTFGCAICYDLRFPALFQALAPRAQVLVLPAAFTLQTGKDHWEVLCRARAIETQCYFLAPAQVGPHTVNNETRLTYGHSLICDPWGQKIAMASDGPWLRGGADRSGAGGQSARGHSGGDATPPLRVMNPEFSFTGEQLDAIFLSLRVGVTATLCSLPFAVIIAYGLARWRFPGKMLIDALVHLPLVLPPVVTGLVLLLTFGRRAPVGAFLADHFGLVFAFRWTGAALAAGVMGFPLMVRAIRLSIEAIDPRLEQAAATLGAPPLAVFFLVTLPLAAPGLIAGAVLGFAKALGEFGATITFVSNIPGETRTIPAEIYVLTQTPGGDSAALAMSLVSAALAVGALIASELLARRMRPRLRGAS